MDAITERDILRVYNETRPQSGDPRMREMEGDWCSGSRAGMEYALGMLGYRLVRPCKDRSAGEDGRFPCATAIVETRPHVG